MKTYKVELTEDFIKEAEDAACPEWKIKIRNLIPEAFQEKLEVGKWYKVSDDLSNSPLLINYRGGSSGYGINGFGKWEWEDLNHSWSFESNPNAWKPATEEEVEKALIKEARNRGLVEGVKFKGLLFQEEYMIHNYTYDVGDNTLYSELRGCGGEALFRNGDWAEPIENSTLKRIEEIEAELKELKEKL